MDLTQKFGISGENLVLRGLTLLGPCAKKLADLSCSRDLVLKRQAVIALGKIGDVSSLDFIESLLAEDVETAKEAASAMALVEDESVPVRLLKGILAAPPPHKAVIIPVFGAYRSENVVFAITRLLSDSSSSLAVKLAAAKVMGEIKDVNFSSPLLGCLSDSDESLQVEALKSLKFIGFDSPSEALDLLTELFTKGASERPKVRSVILSALSSMAGDSHFDILKQALKDTNPRVVANAVEALGKMELNPRKLMGLLKPLLEDVCDSRIRTNIAIALNEADKNTASTVLSSLLNSSEAKDRASAAYAARFVPIDSMAMWLTTLLASENETSVIENILQSLTFFDKDEVFESYVKFLSASNTLTRAGAARALGDIGNCECRDSLTKALAVEEDCSVMAEMISALGKLGDPSLISILAEYLQHTDIRIQANTIDALSLIGTVEIVPFIEPFLNSSDNRVKANAAVALWSMGSVGVLASLCKMLDHININQRSSAAYAIGETGLALHHLLKEPNKYHFLISALKEDSLLTVAVNQGEKSDLTGSKSHHFSSLTESAMGRGVIESSNSIGATVNTLNDHNLQGEIADEKICNFPLKEAEKYFSLIRLKKKDEAREYLDSCLKAEPESLFFKYMKADFFRMSQNIISASKSFLELEEDGQTAGEDFLNAEIHLANICNKAHEQEQSIRAYFKAVKMQLRILDMEADVGLALLEDNEVNEASLLLKNIVSQVPINARLHYVAGRNMLKVKRNEIACKHLFKAYMATPDNGEVLLSLAFSCYKTGRYDFVRIIGRKIESLLGGQSPMAMKVADLVSALDKAGL